MSKIRQNGNWRDIKGIQIRRGGQWLKIRRAVIYSGGQWRVFFIGSDPLSVGISPSILATNQSSIVASSTVSGGRGPYSYQWQLTDDLGSMAIAGATSAKVTITKKTMYAEGILALSVTDADGNTVTAQSYVSFISNN